MRGTALSPVCSVADFITILCLSLRAWRLYERYIAFSQSTNEQGYLRLHMAAAISDPSALTNHAGHPADQECVPRQNPPGH